MALLPVLFVLGAEAQTVPLFPKASDNRQGFLRVINPGGLSGDVTLTAYTDRGERRTTSFAFSRAEEVKHFNADDLEYGNTEKGITGIGQGDSDWRLEFTTDLSLVIPTYMRTKTDGFLTSLRDTVAKEDDTYRKHIFNYGMQDALETGKALLVTAARRLPDGTIVPHELVVQCGDMMEHCVAVPGAYSTSSATAMLSAIAFHLFQTYEDAEDVVSALKSCAEDVGEPGIDREFGLGVIDLRCSEAMMPVIDR